MALNPHDKEVIDRLRRIETRVTKFLESQGFDTKVQRPVWSEGRIEVPSMAVSLKDIIAVVPEGWRADDEIEIHHKGQWVGSFMLPTP